MGTVPFRKLTICDVVRRNHTNKDVIESFKRYLEDPDKKKRIESQECVYCFYAGKMGGAAITKSFCGLCEKEMTFASTCTDRLCKECAASKGLCKHCASDMEYKNRRNLSL